MWLLLYCIYMSIYSWKSEWSSSPTLGDNPCVQGADRRVVAAGGRAFGRFEVHRNRVGSAQRGKELNTQSALADRDGQPSQTCQTLHALFWGCLVKKLVWCEKFLSWFSERKGVKGMSCERVVMHHLLALLNMFNLRHREVDKSCIKSKWGNKSAIMS